MKKMTIKLTKCAFLFSKPIVIRSHYKRKTNKMTYRYDQEVNLRAAIESISHHPDPDMIKHWKQWLALDGVELKEPTGKEEIPNTISRTVYFSSELFRAADDPEQLIRIIGEETAASFIRTVRYAEWLIANDLELNL